MHLPVAVPMIKEDEIREISHRVVVMHMCLWNVKSLFCFFVFLD